MRETKQTKAAAPSPGAVFTPARAGLLQRACDCGTHAGGDQCSGCKKKHGTLQRRAVGHAAVAEAPPIVYDVLRSAGRPLDAPTRSFMESRFRHDFSGVRVHADARASASARSVNALAYTVGNHIVFGAGQYSPQTSAGRRLLAHELAHTLQQRAGLQPKSSSGLEVSAPDTTQERDADAVADAVLAGRPATPSGGQSVRLARQSATATGGSAAGTGTSAPPPAGLTCPVAVNSPGSTITDLLFDSGGTALSPVHKGIIGAFVTSWRALGASTPVRVDGYASVDGSDDLNWRLSCSRSESVVAELAAPSTVPVPGVPRGSINFFAHGETSQFGPSHPPNRRATISAPAPPPPCAPPPCPSPPPGHQLRDPGIPSGSLCRGACGANCDPDACRTVTPLTLCLSDASGQCHRTCTYVVTECGSHQGCVDHDACYDRCAAAGEHDLCPSGSCHCGCDALCIHAFDTVTCLRWAAGHGPQPNRLRFTDPPTDSGTVGGACPP